MPLLRLTTLLLALLATCSRADDSFTCCMGGWKQLRGLSLCDPPCCQGYVERLVHPPLLKSASYCQKVLEEPELQHIKMIPPIMRVRNFGEPLKEKKYIGGRIFRMRAGLHQSLDG